MRKLLWTLTRSLSHICPAFLHVPMNIPYPYITLEPEQTLKGVPWGPSILCLSVKVWSRYTGTQEVLSLANNVDEFFREFNPESFDLNLNIKESKLILLSDGQTRLYNLRLKLLFKEKS